MRSTSVESEMELPYAGLHQLCAPMLGLIDELPGPQRDALRVAFGLMSGEAAEPFLVGLAVLSLMAQRAAERPLVCVFDDAQWLDRPSALLLAFVPSAMAQSQGRITGTITSQEGQPLSGASVSVVGTPLGALTGENALLYVALALPLVFTGAGRWSLDSLRTAGRP